MASAIAYVLLGKIAFLRMTTNAGSLSMFCYFPCEIRAEPFIFGFFPFLKSAPDDFAFAQETPMTAPMEYSKKYMNLKDLLRPQSLADYSTEGLEKLLSLKDRDPKAFSESMKGLDLMTSQNPLAKYMLPNYLNLPPKEQASHLLKLNPKKGTEANEPAFKPFDQKSLLDFKNLLSPQDPTDPHKFAELRKFLTPQSLNNASPLLEPLKEKAWAVVNSAPAPNADTYRRLRKLWRDYIVEVAKAASRVIAAFVFLVAAAAALIYCSLNVPPECFIQEFSDALATGIVIFVATPFVNKLAQAKTARAYVRWILIGVSFILFVVGYLVGESRDSGNAPVYFSALRTILVELAVACIVLAGLELLFREYMESFEEDLGRAWVQLITAGGRLT